MRNSKKQFRKLSILLVLTLVLMVIPISSGKVYAEEETEKKVTGLVVSPMCNPKKGDGGWCYVNYCNNGETLKFKVLNTHETGFGNGTALFLDCISTVKNVSAGLTWNYSWLDSHSRSHLHSFVSERLTVPEKNAIFISSKSKPAEGDNYPVKDSSGKMLFEFEPLEKDNVFLLDASEAMNPNYGFSNSINDTIYGTRVKFNAEKYWLRSQSGEYLDYVGYVTWTGRIDEAQCQDNYYGLSPAMNLDLNNILFSTLVSGEAGQPESEYKLTIIDNKKVYGDKETPFTTSLNGEIERNGNEITVPFKLSGKRIENATQISYLVTDKAWNAEGAEILKYGSMDIVSGNVTSEGVGRFELPDGCEGQSGDDYYVYIFAEDVNGGELTDYASSPVALDIMPLDLTAKVDAYDGCYDGEAHGIDIKASTRYAVVKYGTVEGTYDLEESPELTNAGTKTVYYQVSADGYDTITGSATINIAEKPVKVSGITAEDKQYDKKTSAKLDYSGARIEGWLDDDDVMIDVEGKFSDANVGENKLVNLSYTLSGESKDNYVIDPTSQTYTTASIIKAPLSVSGITAKNKSYDKTDYAELDFSNMEVSGKVDGDDVNVTATGRFASSMITGIEQTVYIENMELVGDDADNYDLPEDGKQTETKATILQNGMPVIKVTGQNYIYDGQEHYIKVEVIDTVEGADPSNVSIEYSDTQSEPMHPEPPKYTNVCEKTINYHVVDSNASPTYDVTDSITFRILKRPVSVSSVAGIEKVYDGTTAITADLSGAVIDGKIEGDDISVVSGNVEFTDASAGEDKTVILDGMTLEGEAAGNYKLSPSARVTGKIKKRPIVVSGVTANNKIYDGTTDATLNTENLKLENVISGDDVTVTATGYFANPNAGKIKDVNIEYTISGDSADNYYIDTENSQMVTTAGVIKNELDIEELSVDTIYDGKEHSALINVKDDVNAVIRYGETEDDISLTESPKIKDACSKLIYYTVDTDDGNYYGCMGYMLVQVQPRLVTVSGIEGKDKVYDGKLDAELNTDKMKLENIIEGEDISIKATGSFETADKGNAKKVNISYELTGDAAKNYRVDLENSQKETTANITDAAPSPTPSPTPEVDSKTILVAKGVASGSRAVNISWNNVKADRYVIYLGKGKASKFKKIKTVSGKKLKFKKNKLAKKSAYKFYVVAQKKNGKKYETIAKSNVGYFFTGNVKGKFTNPKALKLKTKSISVSVGEKQTLKATVTKAKKNKKLATNYAKKLRFVSDNPSVATVDKTGKVTAVSKGSCTIYVQTINGMWKTCKVEVK